VVSDGAAAEACEPAEGVEEGVWEWTEILIGVQGRIYGKCQKSAGTTDVDLGEGDPGGC
jgi:hypothetical protein